jgi:hypothetical protein
MKPMVCALFPLGRVVMTENARGLMEKEAEDNETDEEARDNEMMEEIEDEEMTEKTVKTETAEKTETTEKIKEISKMGLYRPNEIQYVLNPIFCASRKRKQTVRTWLEMFDIPIEDEFFLKWNQTIFKLIEAVQKYEGKEGVTDKALNMLWEAIFMALYMAYDTQQEFYPQFEDNAAKILGVFAELEQVSVIVSQ